jgi:hypothetical protein
MFTNKWVSNIPIFPIFSNMVGVQCYLCFLFSQADGFIRTGTHAAKFFPVYVNGML